MTSLTLSKFTRTASHIKAHLNILKTRPIERREEEIVKFFLKKAIKYIQRYELTGNVNVLKQLKKKYFAEFSQEQFDKLFSTSKE